MLGRANRILSSLGLCIALTSPTFGTSVIIARTADHITIGTDSKRIFDDGTIASVCKISEANDVFITAAGVTALKVTGFDLLDFARRATLIGSTLAEKVAVFEKDVMSPLTVMATRLQRDDPVFPTQYLNSYFMQIGFLSIENGEPVVMIRKYMPVADTDGRLALRVWRYSCPGECANGQGVFLMGEFAAIKAHLESSPGFLDGNLADGIRALLLIQVAASPAKVGLPINILRIGKRIIEWVDGGENSPTVRIRP